MVATLISIEGIDGSGKTTLSQELSRHLSAGARVTLLGRKQTDGYRNAYVSRLMSGLAISLWGAAPGDPVEEVPEKVWMQLHASWYELMDRHLIRELEHENDFIVVDGWFYKCLARHGANGVYQRDLIAALFGKLRSPDRVYFLDVAPAVCWERRESFRGSELGAHSSNSTGTPRERFINYQSRVRKEYLSLRDLGWHSLTPPRDEGPVDLASRLARELLGAKNNP